MTPTAVYARTLRTKPLDFEVAETVGLLRAHRTKNVSDPQAKYEKASWPL